MQDLIQEHLCKKPMHTVIKNLINNYQKTLLPHLPSHYKNKMSARTVSRVVKRQIKELGWVFSVSCDDYPNSNEPEKMTDVDQADLLVAKDCFQASNCFTRFDIDGQRYLWKSLTSINSDCVTFEFGVYKQGELFFGFVIEMRT